MSHMKFVRMTPEAMVEVLEGAIDGKEIQFKDHYGNWVECRNPVWAFCDTHYRVKPEARTFYMEMDSDGMIRSMSTKLFTPRVGCTIVTSVEVLDNSIG